MDLPGDPCGAREEPQAIAFYRTQVLFTPCPQGVEGDLPILDVST